MTVRRLARTAIEVLSVAEQPPDLSPDETTTRIRLPDGSVLVVPTNSAVPTSEGVETPPATHASRARNGAIDILRLFALTALLIEEAKAVTEFESVQENLLTYKDLQH